MGFCQERGVAIGVQPPEVDQRIPQSDRQTGRNKTQGGLRRRSEAGIRAMPRKKLEGFREPNLAEMSDCGYNQLPWFQM
jgi:hypothetical protein